MSDGTGALVSAIYGAAREPSRWNSASLEVARHFHASVAIFVAMRARGEELSPIRVATWGIAPETINAWTERNPWRRGALGLAGGTVIMLRAFDGPGGVPHDFYRQVIEPHSMQHALAGVAVNAGPSFGAYSVYRDKPFDEAEARSFAALATAFEHATLLEEYLRRSMEWLQGASTPTILLAADQTVCFVNAAAERLLTRSHVLGLKERALRPASVLDARTLEDLLRRVLAGAASGRSAVALGCDGEVVGITAMSIKGERSLPGAPPEAALALFLSDPVTRTGEAVEFMRQSFMLTAAEAHVFEAILSGKGLPAASAALGIAPTTAKTHLQHIFQKTGTRHQAELVRLAFGASPSL